MSVQPSHSPAHAHLGLRPRPPCSKACLRCCRPICCTCWRAWAMATRSCIADANFPAATHARRLVSMPGVRRAQVLDAVLSVLPLDDFVDQAAFTMQVVGDTRDQCLRRCRTSTPCCNATAARRRRRWSALRSTSVPPTPLPSWPAARPASTATSCSRKAWFGHEPPGRSQGEYRSASRGGLVMTRRAVPKGIPQRVARRLVMTRRAVPKAHAAATVTVRSASARAPTRVSRSRSSAAASAAGSSSRSAN